MKKLILLVVALMSILGACEYPPDYLAYASASRALMGLSHGYRSIFISGEELEGLLEFWPLKDYPIKEQGELLSVDLSLIEGDTYFYLVRFQTDKSAEEIKDEYSAYFKDGWEKSGNVWTALSTRDGHKNHNTFCSITSNKKGAEVYFSFDFYDVPTKRVSDFLEARWPKIRGIPDLGKPSGMDYGYYFSEELITVDFGWDVGAEKAGEIFEELRDTLSGYENFCCDDDIISFMTDDMIVMVFYSEYISISVMISTDDINEKTQKAD